MAKKINYDEAGNICIGVSRIPADRIITTVTFPDRFFIYLEKAAEIIRISSVDMSSSKVQDLQKNIDALKKWHDEKLASLQDFFGNDTNKTTGEPDFSTPNTNTTAYWKQINDKVHKIWLSCKRYGFKISRYEIGKYKAVELLDFYEKFYNVKIDKAYILANLKN
jgi:hypothetical protein